jgi:hypothetical protein
MSVTHLYVLQYLPESLPPKRIRTGPPRYGGTVTPKADFRVEIGSLGYLSRALWCLVPHVVSGLATSILYMNESG